VSRGRRIALAAGSLLLGLAAVLAGAWWFVTARGDRIVAAAGTAIGRKVEADELGLGLRGGFSVALRGVRVADDPAFEPGRPFLSASRLDMRIQLWPLLERMLVVDRIVVHEPVVNLIQDRSGRMNVDSLRRQTVGVPPTDHAEPRSQRPAFRLARFELRHGTVRYRGGGRTLDLEDVGVDAQQPQLDGPIPVEVHMRVRGSQVEIDDVVSAGVLDLGEEPPPYRGTVQTGRGTLGPLALDRLDADLVMRPPEAQAKITVSGGHIAAYGIGPAALEVLGPVLGGGAGARLRERYPDLFASDDLRFTRLTATARRDGERVRFDDMVIAGASYEVHGAGSLVPGGDIDVDVSLSASPGLTEDLVGRSPEARAVLVDDHGVVTIPLRITGPVARPHVRPPPEFTAQVARAVFESQGLRGLADTVLDKLLKPKRKRDR
jgi:hypothetical protein